MIDDSGEMAWYSSTHHMNKFLKQGKLLMQQCWDHCLYASSPDSQRVSQPNTDAPIHFIQEQYFYDACIHAPSAHLKHGTLWSWYIIYA